MKKEALYGIRRKYYFVTTIAEYILERHISEVRNYTYLRTSDNNFLVSRSVIFKCDTLIPKFL